MSSQIPRLGAGAVTIESVSTAKPNTLIERDSAGDAAVNKLTAEAAMHSKGALFVEPAARTASHAITASNGIELVTAAGGAVTYTLPAASACDGQVVIIKRTDSGANLVTIDGNGAETIDGDLTIFLTVQYETVWLVSDGAGWHLLQRYVPLRGFIAKAANFTVTGEGLNYLVTVGAGGVTVTLPPAANAKDKRLTFKRADAGAGNFILDGNGAETVDGTATVTLSATQYTATTIQSDGTSWHTVSNKS